MKGDLFLIRGLPGSGKSELAKSLSFEGKYPVYSVDDYFTDVNGNYQFIFSENHLAYKLCEENCRKSMESSCIKIFIDNVFSFDWEMQPYYKLAEEFRYRIFVLCVENRHGGKNIHGIPEEQIQKIEHSFEVKLNRN